MSSDEQAYYQERVRKNLDLNKLEIEQGRTRLQSTPAFIKIDLMGACNMRPYCCICDLEAENPLRHRGLDVEALRACGELLDGAERIWDGSTGEALLHPRFPDLIAEWTRKGKRVGFTTGGLALTSRITDRLSPFFESLEVTVSLDAATADTFSRLRGNCFDEIIGNLKYFLKRRQECAPTRHGGVGVSFIPMRTNRHEIPLLFDLARALGVDFIVFRPLHYRPVNKVVVRDGFRFDYWRERLSVEELEECRQAALEASASTGMLFVCEYHVSGPERFDEYQPRGLEHAQPACLLPWRFVKLIHDGRTFPCVYITESMGDWQRDGLGAVWNNPKWVRLREELAAGAPAGLCYRAPSCPVVRRLASRREHVEVQALVQRSRVADDVYRFRLCDKAFYFLVDEGVYEPEGSAGDGMEFRWLGPEASWRLPNPFPGRSGWLSMCVRTHKPDAASKPVHLRVSVDGGPSKEVILRSTAGTPVIMWLAATSSSTFSVHASARDPWVPKQYPSSGSPSDSRRLSVQVAEVVLSTEELEECSQSALFEQPPPAVCLRWRAAETAPTSIAETEASEARADHSPCLFPWRFASLGPGGVRCVHIMGSSGQSPEECSGTLRNDPKWGALRDELASSPMADLSFKARACPIVKRVAEQQEELAALVGDSRQQSGVYHFRLSDRRHWFLLEEGLYEPHGSSLQDLEFRWLGAEASWRLPNPFPGREGWLVVSFRSFKPDSASGSLRIWLAVDGRPSKELIVSSVKRHLGLIRLAASGASTFRLSVRAENAWTPKDYPECGRPDDSRILSVQVGDNLLARSLASLVPSIFRVIIAGGKLI